MDNKALVKADSRRIGSLRSIWTQYREAKSSWHVVVPVGLAAMAGAALTWAWTMLDQQEYGVAMLLVIFFLVIGIGTSLAILIRTVKVLALVLVMMVTAFSGLKILNQKGDKPWSTLMEHKGSTESPSPAPVSAPTFTPVITMPTAVASPSPSASPRSQAAGQAGQRSRKLRHNKLTPTELRERQEILRALESKRPENAHVMQAPAAVTKEALKEALAKKRTKKGLQFLVEEVRRRGVAFCLTPEIEKELRDHAAKGGNTSIDNVITTIRNLELQARIDAVLSQPIPSPTLDPKPVATPIPTPSPTPDWKKSEEAKQLAAQLIKEVEKLMDEGRVMDLTNFDQAIKVYNDWIESAR
jgi:hypothetical protein